MIGGITPSFPGTGPGAIGGDFDESFYSIIPASLALGTSSYLKNGSCPRDPTDFYFFNRTHEQKFEGSGTGSTDNESATFNDDELTNEDDSENVNHVKSSGFITNCVGVLSDGNVSGMENVVVNVEVNSNKNATSTGFISLQNDVTTGESSAENHHIKDLNALNCDIITPQDAFAYQGFNNPVYRDTNTVSAYSTIPSLSNTPSVLSNSGYHVAPDFPGAIMGFNSSYGYPEVKFYGLEGNGYPVIPNFGYMPGYGNHVAQMTPNSTIDGESIVDDTDDHIGPDGTAPPANKRDPIYTAISGLKWKAKSKKWVVRWDNPVTNRRVYKYFSGTRYGFMGAHKRAKYYLEFLNASVGRIPTPSSSNPFCRRTEGPPKGKTNKGLLRKMAKTFPVEQFMGHQFVSSNIDPRVLPHNASEICDSDMNEMGYLGSSAKNPLCINSLTQQRNCSNVQKFYV